MALASFSALAGPWTKIPFYALFRFTATNCGNTQWRCVEVCLCFKNTKNDVGSVTTTAVNLRTHTHTHTDIKQTYFFLFSSKSTFNTNYRYYGILNIPFVTRTMRCVNPESISASAVPRILPVLCNRQPSTGILAFLQTSQKIHK